MTSGFDAPFLLGMMRLSDSPSLSDPRTLADWIEARLDEGLTWFDHADTYGDRRCEALFGEALALRPALKSRIHTVAKAGVVLPGRDTSRFGVKHYDTSPAYLGQAIDGILSRLGVEHLDHFLVQRPDPLMDVSATAHVLDTAIAAGKVGAVGISNFLPEQWRRLQQAMTSPLVVNQLELSLAHPASLFNGLYDAVLSDGHQPIARSSLGGGSVFEDVLGTAIERMAKELQISHAGLALAWLRRLPGQPVPVIGTLKDNRIHELAREGRVDLDRPTWFALLEEARSQRVG